MDHQYIGSRVNFRILCFSSTQALSMSSLHLAPVKTTFPEAKIKTDFIKGRFLQTTPGKFSFFITFLSSHNLDMWIRKPMSALATMFVILNFVILAFIPMALEISLTAFLAEYQASLSDSEPIIIIRPDLKHKTVHFGRVFLIITAGKRFRLYREPSTFSAICLRFSSPWTSISAKETTFWTTGRRGQEEQYSTQLFMIFSNQTSTPCLNSIDRVQFYGLLSIFLSEISSAISPPSFLTLQLPLKLQVQPTSSVLLTKPYFLYHNFSFSPSTQITFLLSSVGKLTLLYPSTFRVQQKKDAVFYGLFRGSISIYPFS